MVKHRTTGTKRQYVDPPDAIRCTAVCRLPDGSTVDCGRRRKIGKLCRQHYAILRDSLKEYDRLALRTERNMQPQQPPKAEHDGYLAYCKSMIAHDIEPREFKAWQANYRAVQARQST